MIPPRYFAPIRAAAAALALCALAGCEDPELEKREKDVASREAAIRIHDANITQREKAVVEQRLALDERANQLESSLAERAAALDAREAKLAEMEEAVEAKLSVLRRGPVPSVYAKRTIIVDVHSGEPLYEKNADELCAVASTQKLLTALLVIENCDLDEAITVEREDADVAPTRVGIKPGETYTRRQLLTSLLVRSGNDIAVCLARTTAGSVEAFVEMMNARAAQLGMANSHFKNPHGLTEEGQHSTARDMALLARVAYANPIIHEIVQIEEYDFKFNDGSVRELFNTNKVLKSYEPCNGMKTGYTVASGNCLVSSGQVGDREIIAVVLGSTSSWVWRDSEALLDWALKDV